MGFLIIVVIIVAIVAMCFIRIKLSNLKYRAKQEILKDTGLSSSEINNSITSGLEKKHLERLLSDNPMYTEESIKNVCKEYAAAIVNRVSRTEFSDRVNQKIGSDRKLDKLQSMSFKRVTISSYSNFKFGVTVIYTDNRDEYNVVLGCIIVDGTVTVDAYNIMKGTVVGF